MQRKGRLAAWATAAALMLAGCGGGTDGTGGGAVPVGSLDLSSAGAAGRALFDAKCATCHRSDLTGGVGPALGPGSAAAGKPLADLETTIRLGGNGMPTWGELLTDREIGDLLAFLSEAQGR